MGCKHPSGGMSAAFFRRPVSGPEPESIVPDGLRSWFDDHIVSIIGLRSFFQSQAHILKGASDNGSYARQISDEPISPNFADGPLRKLHAADRADADFFIYVSIPHNVYPQLGV